MDPIGNKPYGFMVNPLVLRSYIIIFNLSYVDEGAGALIHLVENYKVKILR